MRNFSINWEFFITNLKRSGTNSSGRKRLTSALEKAMQWRERTRSTSKTKLFFSTVLLLVVSGAVQAHSQTCGLDGRLIEFQGSYCFQGSCNQIHDRIRILGSKVLLYLGNTGNTGFDDTGLEFQIGKTVDIYSDDFGVLYFNGGKRPGNGRRTGSATASSVGTDLYLVDRGEDVLDNQEIFYSSQRYWVQIPTCDTCKFVSFEMETRYRNGMQISTFTPGWCRVLE